MDARTTSMDPIQQKGLSLADLAARATLVYRAMAVAGWRGYTLVALQKQADGWSVASRARVCVEDEKDNYGYDYAMRATHRELLRLAPTEIQQCWRGCVTNRHPYEDYSGAPGTNFDSPFYEDGRYNEESGLGVMRAWLMVGNAEFAVVYLLPDVVWGLHLPEFCGPLLAVARMPDGGRATEADDRAWDIERVCLGSAVRAHFSDLQNEFVDRAVGAAAGSAVVPLQVLLSLPPLCTLGASMTLERLTVPRRQECWCAVPVAPIRAGDPLYARVYAPKK